MVLAWYPLREPASPIINTTGDRNENEKSQPGIGEWRQADEGFHRPAHREIIQESHPGPTLRLCTSSQRNGFHD